MTEPTTTTDWIDRYFEKGWAPIPIEPGQKRPLAGLQGWQKLDLAEWPEEKAKRLWAEGQPGVGLLLGKPSGGLVDVDLDSLEAIAIASAALPPTLTSGRETARASHRWYRLADGGVSTTKWVDPVADFRDGGGDRAVLLELRADGAQTLVEPSAHPSGEHYEWEGGLDDVADIADADDFLHNLHLLGAAALLARYWPYEGQRHDASVALCGALIGNHLDYWSGGDGSGHPTEAFLHAVRVIGGDDEHRGAAVRTTLRRVARSGKVSGWPTLADIYGRRDASDAVWQAKEWVEEAMLLVGAAPTHLPTEEEIDGALGDIAPSDDGYEESGGTYGAYSRYRTDLAAWMNDPPEPPAAVIPGFLYEGMAAITFGERGTGKTLLTIHCGMELAARGQSMVWIDYQNGSRLAVERIMSLGGTPLLNDHIHHIAQPGIDLSNRENAALLRRMVQDTDTRLVVIDSMMDAVALARDRGLDSNSGDDIVRFMDDVIGPLKQMGVAVMIHDHASKADKFSTKGSNDKENSADLVWRIHNSAYGSKAPPNRKLGGIGYVVAEQTKMRNGITPNFILWEVEPYGEVITSESGVQYHAHTRIHPPEFREDRPTSATVIGRGTARDRHPDPLE